MGDASAVRLAIAEEVTFGVNPAANFNFLRFTNEGLKHSQATIQSEEIDPDRNPAGRVRTNIFAEGPISAEMSLVAPAEPAAGFDMLIEGALQTDFSTIIAGVNEEIDISNISGGTFDLDDVHVSADAFANAVVGQWLKLTGFAVNGTIWAHITAKASDAAISCEGLRDSGLAVTAEVGQTAIGISGSMARVGTTKHSYTLEKQFTDLTVPEYSLFTGMRIGTWEERVNPQAIIVASFGLLGKLAATTTSTGAGSPAAKWATGRLNAVDGVKGRYEGVFTAETALRIAELSFRFDNRLRTEPEVGVLGSTDIGISTVVLEGTINAYMTTADLVRKVEDQTFSKLSYRLDDGTRQQIRTFPNIQYTDGQVLAQGNDQSVLAQLQWAAEADSNQTAFQVDRFA